MTKSFRDAYVFKRHGDVNCTLILRAPVTSQWISFKKVPENKSWINYKMTPENPLLIRKTWHRTDWKLFKESVISIMDNEFSVHTATVHLEKRR